MYLCCDRRQASQTACEFLREVFVEQLKPTYIVPINAAFEFLYEVFAHYLVAGSIFPVDAELVLSHKTH